MQVTTSSNYGLHRLQFARSVGRAGVGSDIARFRRGWSFPAMPRLVEMKTQQEIHLVPERFGGDSPSAQANQSTVPCALPLQFAPTLLNADPAAPLTGLPTATATGDTVVVEPFLNPLKQLRLLVTFPERMTPTVNGEPAPCLAVLAPGDFFQWRAGVGFRVALFSRPCLGPPPEALLGRPCPVCTVPFVLAATCYTCVCGVVLHCEADEKGGLQCAQLRRQCPTCKRPVMLVEGYLEGVPHED